MSLVGLVLLIGIDMFFSCLMNRKYQIKDGSEDRNLKTKFVEFLDCLKTNMTKNTKKAQIRILWEKIIEDTSIWKMTKIVILL